MPNLRVIDGGGEPVTPANAVRKRVRAKRQRDLPQCTHCGGRETIVASAGNVRNKLCVVCLTQGRRVVVS
jgi:hypothetical protein